ncbi:BCL2 adenovirus E1B 19 kDa protein-interacting 3 [Solea senegalensis]|nr:BCL2 adenovirus E1B 19 kDa protein-interacting 3 [Solea senegalensis]
MDTQDCARTTSPDDILIGSWVDLQFNSSDSPYSSLHGGQEQISVSSDESADIEIMLLDAQHESGRSSSAKSSPCNSPLEPETLYLTSSSSEENIPQADQDFQRRRRKVKKLRKTNLDSLSLAETIPLNSLLRPETFLFTSSGSEGNISQSDQDSQVRLQEVDNLMETNSDSSSLSVISSPDSPLRLETPDLMSSSSEGNISQSEEDFQERRQDDVNILMRKHSDWMEDLLSRSESNPPNSPVTPILMCSDSEEHISQSDQGFRERRQEVDDLMKETSDCLSLSENIPPKSPLTQETILLTSSSSEGNISQLDVYLEERRQEVDNLIKTISDCSSRPEISPPNSPQRPETSLHTSSSSEGNISPSGQDSQERGQEVDNKSNIADWRSRPENNPPKDFLLKHPKRSTFLCIKETSVLKEGGILSSGYPKYFLPSLIFSHIVAFGIGIYFGKRIASHNSI